MTDPDCICGGTGLTTRLAEGGGNTGPEVCTDCFVPRRDAFVLDEQAIERAARALCEKECVVFWNARSDDADHYRELARVAVAALRNEQEDR